MDSNIVYYFTRAFENFGDRDEDSYDEYEYIVPLIYSLVEPLKDPHFDLAMEIITHLVHENNYEFRNFLNRILNKILDIIEDKYTCDDACKREGKYK